MGLLKNTMEIKIPLTEKIVNIKHKYEIGVEYILLTFIAGLTLGLTI